MPSLTTALQFLQSTLSIPIWLILLLLLILLIQFVDIYKKKGIIRVEKSRNLTDNKFTKSVITTVEKITHIPDNGLTNSIITTAKKIQKEIAAKKQQVASNKPIKENIMKLLFEAGGEGRLQQSLADELKIEGDKVFKLVNELIDSKLIEKRKTTFGETYYLSQVGSEYCVRNKLIKI